MRRLTRPSFLAGTPVAAILDSLVQLVFATYFPVPQGSGNLPELPLSQVILAYLTLRAFESRVFQMLPSSRACSMFLALRIVCHYWLGGIICFLYFPPRGQHAFASCRTVIRHPPWLLGHKRGVTKDLKHVPAVHR